MGELRLYAIGIDEMRGMVGADEGYAVQLREFAQTALAPDPVGARSGGLLSRLGPIFRRVPASPVIGPTDPEPHDVDVLLAGAYVPPERAGATWRVLETMVQGVAWGSTRLELDDSQMDDLDFALARGGVSAAVGLRHLLNSTTSVGLLPVTGLTVGWHPYQKALMMASAYRAAMAELKTPAQQELISALVIWLDGFVPWSEVAERMGRPAPDLIGFYAG
jgi:hypothetical protein